jgi:hypothetical protein
VKVVTHLVTQRKKTSLPKGHSAALFLSPQQVPTQQQRRRRQQQQQQQHVVQANSSQVSSRVAGHATTDSVQLCFTKMLLDMRRTNNQFFESAAATGVGMFDVNQLVDARCVDSAYLEDLLESIFDMTENSLEIKVLLDVIIALTLQSSVENQECFRHLLCDAAADLMSGELEVLYAHAVVCYVVDAVDTMGVTKSIVNKLVELPWVSSNLLLRFRVASIIKKFHEEQKMNKKKSAA